MAKRTAQGRRRRAVPGATRSARAIPKGGVSRCSPVIEWPRGVRVAVAVLRRRRGDVKCLVCPAVIPRQFVLDGLCWGCREAARAAVGRRASEVSGVLLREAQAG